MTQGEMEVLAQNQTLNGDQSAGLLLSLLPDRCITQIKRAVCLAVFQACELVDPFYVDPNSCAIGEFCTPCGNVSHPFKAFSAANLQPSYSSACVSASNVNSAIPSNCIVGPGKVPGYGDIGYQLLSTLENVPITELCTVLGLTWDSNFQSCVAAVPRSPCKSECDLLWNMNRTVIQSSTGTPMLEAVCPLVSGNFTLVLEDLAALNSDPNVQTQAKNALKTGTSGSTTITLLAAFSMAPNCMSTENSVFTYSLNYTQEFLPKRSLSLGQLIISQASQIVSKSEQCQCQNNIINQLPLEEQTNSVCNPQLDSSYCDYLIGTTALCNTNGGSVSSNPLVRFVDVDAEGINPICEDIILSPVNQPPNATLDIFAAANNLPSRTVAMGAFFVPPEPGLPILPYGKMSRDLCAIPNRVRPDEVFTGHDSFECLVATFNSSVGAIPGFLDSQCRLSFLDLICNQAYMKLEFKSLCLQKNCAATDVQGAATNQIPFIFALPRFPARSLCLSVRTNCNSFIESLGPIGTPKRDAIEVALNCSQTISSSCALNNPLDGWSSNYWSCKSNFNGLPAYPETSQVLLNINALLGSYAAANGLDLSNLAVTDVSVAAFSNQTNDISCECPFPLVVPDDPLAPTLSPGICCQQQCQGYAFTPSQFSTIFLVLKIVPILSVIGTLFVILTWSCFKVKRGQPLTLMFGICSFMVALAFLIPEISSPDLTKVWCKDNTQPNLQVDGGMCVFQSIWLSYWVIGACCFWLVQAWDLFMRIVKNQRHLDHLTKYYHMIGWGVPLLVVVVVLGTQAAGYQQGQLWCFITDPDNVEFEVGLELGLFYGIIISVTAIGFVLMIMVLYQIFKITSKTASTQTSSSLSKRLALYRTPVFFVFFFMYVWISIFTWRFSFEAYRPLVTVSAEDWIQCLLTNFAAGISNPAFDPTANNSLVQKYGIANGTGCGEVYPVGISFGSVMYLLFILSLQGVFVFFIFGAKLENFNLWREKFGLTSKKFDTGPQDSSSTKEKNPKPSALTSAMSNLFSSPSSPKKGSSDHGGGSAVMVNAIQSGKFLAVTEDNIKEAKPAQVAAYMQE